MDLSTTQSFLFLGVFGSFALLVFVRTSSPQNQERELDASSSSPRRPPLVPSWIPFLGSAIAYGKNVDEFLMDTKRTHDSIFTLYLAGRRLTYVTTPGLISAVYKSSKALEFTPIRQELSTTLFGMSTELSSSEYIQREIFPAYHRLLARGSVGGATTALVEKVEVDLVGLIPEGQTEVEIGLQELTVRGLYDATSEAFLGKDFDTSSIYSNFLKYDDGFPMLAGGLPPLLSGAVRSSLSSLTTLRSAFLSFISHHPFGTPTTSSLIRETLESLSTEGISKDDQASMSFSTFWAATANVSWAQYWVLIYVLGTPGVAQKLRAQVDEMFDAWTKVEGGKGSFGEMLLADDFRRLDSGEGMEGVRSCVKETLRMCSASFSVRLVKEDTVLDGGSTEEGRWAFEKGEKVICATRLVHFDPEIYPNPTTFDPTRFLPAPGTTPIKSSHFLPFGGGVSQCEGRFFAMRELVAFTSLALHHLDFEYAEEEGVGPNRIPEMDLYRAGVGILHPKGEGDVKLRVRRRV